MREAGLRPDEESYNSMINACAKEGDVQQAEHWFRQMCGAGLRPNSESYIGVTNAKREQARLARRSVN